ncbi:MAG: bifunctional folylpolyglutamate synthase/dihydrofolate synthase, partial [Clostridiales bacterium]|nr:bifunctional folylpolyglutamate synthase/dihydrofolate synthase [Clostridiales bacterium]
MNYQEALAYLDKSRRIGYKHTLDVFSEVVYNFLNPSDDLRVIHVAGTNGKGSVCAMLASVLTAAGFKTGRYTSPHLNRVNERIAIDGAPIGDADFAAAISAAKAAADARGETLTFFELLTAAAFYHFHEKNVDFVVLETGLGGRLDAT